MSYEARFKAHEQLMTRMADANGADLDLAMQTGSLSPESYEAAVHNAHIACLCNGPLGGLASVCGQGKNPTETWL